MTHTDIYEKSISCRDYEPVPGDFLIKKTGMDIISKFVDLNGSAMGLEIGCGSGYNAALLSCATRRLIATDLPDSSVESHSLGISVAKDLLGTLGAKNVRLVSCSGETLPFGDDTFDFIFSSSVLEHIDDKKAALKEMLRVVKPNGRVIFVIPTFVQSMCAFVHLYLYIARRIGEVMSVKLFKQSVKKKTLLPMRDDASRASAKIVDSFRVSHPSFPLPEPHGSYKNIFEEFSSQLPWRWTSLARECGARSTDSFAFLFLPFNVLEVFSTRIIADLYSGTKSLHQLLGKSFLKYFSYSYCVVARK